MSWDTQTSCKTLCKLLATQHLRLKINRPPSGRGSFQTFPLSCDWTIWQMLLDCGTEPRFHHAEFSTKRNRLFSYRSINFLVFFVRKVLFLKKTHLQLDVCSTELKRAAAAKVGADNFLMLICLIMQTRQLHSVWRRSSQNDHVHSMDIKSLTWRAE